MPDESVITAPDCDTPMTLDAQVRQRLDSLIDRVSSDLAHQLRGLADELVSAATAERTDAVRQAVQLAEEQAERRASEAAADARLAVAGAREDVRVATEATAAERAARAGERDSMLAGFERLLTHLATLDAASSLRGVLDAFADGLASAGARSWLLVRRGDIFRGWRLTGFGAQAPEAWSVSLAADASGPFAAAIRDGKSCEVHPDVFGALALPESSFASLSADRAGLAVPVCLGRTTVALGYVDDGGAQDRVVPGAWPEIVQILARHTSRCLEALTARRAMTAGLVPSAPGGRAFTPAEPVVDRRGSSGGPEAAERYARLLVSEIRLYNESAIRQGRQQRDLRHRLRTEIDRARRMYEERVSASLPGRRDYFERELLRTLADGDPEALGAE